MKTKLILVAIVVFIIGAGIMYMEHGRVFERPIAYVATTTPEVIEVKDVLDEARERLEKVTAELKAEEDKLKAEIVEREKRLEEIKAIRLNF